MQIGFIDILGITAPIMLVVLLGYLAVKSGLFPEDGAIAISKFVVNFALPAALFFAIVTHDLGELFDAKIMLVVFAAMFVVYLTSFFLTRAKGMSLTQSGFDGLGSMGCNMMMVALPVLLLVFPERAYMPVILGSLVQDLSFIPITLIIAGIDGQKASLRDVALAVIKKIFTSPMIVAILSGVIVSAMGLNTPLVILRTSETLSGALSGAGLFAIGTIIAGVKLEGMMLRAIRVSVLKLIALPLIALVMFLFVPGIAPLDKTVMVIALGAPTFGAYAAIAETYGVGRSAGLNSTLATTCSFVTMTLLIWGMFLWQPFGALG